ncbi:MAG: ADP-ribosyltransferase [Dysgonamonadaceae bacterium]|jgi:hypothetical protein|nr:ADP-ribosyltransferase [Dysgonamonadaceae bacterium]
MPNKYDKQHLRNTGLTEKQIAGIYNSAIKEATALGASINNFNPDKPFSFDDYPQTKARIDRIIKKLGENTETAIVNGVRSEWTLANNKNNALCDRVFGDNKYRLTKAQERKYYSNNDKAREAFLQRKTAGLNLSDRVWNYTDQFKTEIEMGLDLGIRNGLPAAEMARDIKQYLKYPNELYRRVRDEHGQLQLSKSAKKHNPGQGVYRSSYKNALRLASTETNIAYRTSDHERWQQLDFVVGIEIRLSNNHTLNGVPFTDICDDLAGKYPKDFKFTGWHPNCRCFAISILKTEDELEADSERIINGEAPDSRSVNEIKDVPDNFKKWVEANKDRIDAANNRGTLPYFLKDNYKSGDIDKGFVLIKRTTNVLPETSELKPTNTIEDIYSAERKKNALKFKKDKDADNYMRDTTGEIWQSLDGETKKALVGYTAMDFKEINSQLYKNHKENRKAELITKAIEKSTFKNDIYLARGASFDEVSGIFGIDNKKLGDLARFKISSNEKELKKLLIGKQGVQEGFMSCGTSKNKGLNGEIEYVIYAPKGTQMMYAEPFSAFGGHQKGINSIKWDGKERQNQFGGEQETIINRGYEMKITNVQIAMNNKIRVFVDILSRGKRSVK